MSEKKIVNFLYLTQKNHKYLEGIAKKTGQSKTYCANALMDAMRNDEELYIPQFVPKFVQRAREYEKGKR